jgi:chromosome segregation ATPase
VEQEFSCLQAELARLHEIIKEKNALESQKRDEKDAEIQKLSEKIKALNTQAEQEKREIESLRMQLAEKESENSSLKKSSEEVSRKLENAQQTLISLDSKHKALTAKKYDEISTFKSSLDEVCGKLEHLQHACKLLDERIAKSDASHAEMELLKNDVAKLNTKLTDEKNQFESRINELSLEAEKQKERANDALNSDRDSSLWKFSS